MMRVSLLACFMLASSAFGAEVTLTLKKEATVMKARVFMADLASCSGEECIEVDGIYVGPAPLPGKKPLMSRFHLKQLIQQELPGTGVTFAGPEMIQVESLSREIQEQELLDSINEVMGRLIGDSSEVRVKAERLLHFRSIPVPMGPIVLRFPRFDSTKNPSLQWLAKNLSGVRSMEVQIGFGEGETTWQNHFVQVGFRTEIMIPVASKTLPAGRVLSEKDMVSEWVPIDRLSTDLVFSGLSIKGMKLRQTLENGQEFYRRNLHIPVLIERGAEVKVVWKSQGIEMHTRGASRENGRAGQIIEIQTAKNQQRIRARVIDSKTVEAVEM